MGHFGASAGGNACGTEVPRGLKPAPQIEYLTGRFRSWREGGKSRISRGGSGVGGKGENRGSHAAVPELGGRGRTEYLTRRFRSWGCEGGGGKKSRRRGSWPDAPTYRRRDPSRPGARGRGRGPGRSPCRR